MINEKIAMECDSSESNGVTNTDTTHESDSRIPTELKQLNQWLCWRLENVKGKSSKTPYNAKTGYYAKTNKPETWTSFEIAQKALLNGGNYSGLGFVFSNSDGLTGLDVDHCYDKASKRFTEIGNIVLALFKGSYCEFSPSGEGLRIFCKGVPIRSGKGTVEKTVEVYNHKSPRYLTVTGNHIAGTSLEITEQQKALNELHKLYFDKPMQTTQETLKPAKKSITSDIVNKGSLSDDDILAIIRKAKNASKFESLFSGGGNEDESSGDLALCGLLGFYTQCEGGGGAGQLDRLFRLSNRTNLRNGKWDKVHHADGRTYGKATIDLVINGLKKTYKPRQQSKVNGSNAATTENANDNRPMVIINGTSLSKEQTPICLNALAAKNRNKPYLFSKNNKLVRIELSTDRKGIMSLNIKNIDIDTLIHELERVVRFVIVRSKEDEMYYVDTNPPKSIAKDILAFPDFPDFPQLERVVTAPCVTYNGKVITRKGYDDESGIFYHQHERMVIPDTTPTPDNVNRAKSLILDDLLVDFPFDSEASRANAIAFFIVPFCRDLIDGCTPFHFFTAPSPGTGKSLLATTIAHIFNPFVHVSTAPVGRNPNDVEEEWRKKITTLLMSMPSHAIFDNAQGLLASANLAAVLTTTTWSDRILGNSAEVTMDNKSLWAATGNNAELSTDLARRTLEIRLDANMEKPYERHSFKHHNIDQWAKENRGELIAAAIILIRNWLEQGKPKPINTTQMGSFEQYRHVIGGILQAADIQGFLQNYKETQERVDSNTLMFQEFFDGWYNGIPVESMGITKTVGKFTDKPQHPNELHGVAKEAHMFDDLLNARDEKAETMRLGRWLQKNLGKVYGQYKLTGGDKKKNNVYRLKKIDKPPLVIDKSTDDDVAEF